MHLAYHNLDETSGPARLDGDQDSDNSGSDASDGNYVSRSQAKSQSTSPRQIPSLKNPLNFLSCGGDETDGGMDSDSETDVAFIREGTQYFDAESTPPASQSWTQRQNSGAGNSKPTSPLTPTVGVEEETPTPKLPVSTMNFTFTREDRAAAKILANLSSGHLNSLIGQQGKKIAIEIPRYDPQALQQSDLMTVDESDLPAHRALAEQQCSDITVLVTRETTREALTAVPHGDPRVVQSMSVDEFEDPQPQHEPLTTQPQFISSVDEAVQLTDAIIDEIESQNPKKRRLNDNVPDKLSKSVS
jgi:hypothetical protein